MTEHESDRPRLTLALVATLAVAACNQAEERRFETDVEDTSGGKLIVSEEDRNAVDVDLPETEMTNAPVEEDAPADE